MAKRFDVESLVGVKELLEALETEDVLGSVLRAQLRVEQAIEVFLSAALTADMLEVFNMPQNFAPKVMLASALGLPKEICLAALSVNALRNKFAHRSGWELKASDIDVLVDRYEAARAALDPSGYEMRKSSIRLHSLGSEKIDFGAKSLGWDFKMVSAGITSLILKYLVRQNESNGYV